MHLFIDLDETLVAEAERSSPATAALAPPGRPLRNVLVRAGAIELLQAAAELFDSISLVSFSRRAYVETFAANTLPELWANAYGREDIDSVPARGVAATSFWWTTCPSITS